MEIETFSEINHHYCNGESIEIVTHREFSQLLASQPQRTYPGPHRRQIKLVPPQIRRRSQLYSPNAVSLGPYHHGKPELHQAEEFKYRCLDWCARGDEGTKVFFYNKIFERVKGIRDSYAEVEIVNRYGDKALALMMLLDGCIIVNYMHNCICESRNNYLDWKNCLGAAGSNPFMLRDMMVLENQIPFQVLKLLIDLQYEKEEADGFLLGFFSHIQCKDFSRVRIPNEIEDPPIHFLEAWWRVLATKNIQIDKSRFRWLSKLQCQTEDQEVKSRFPWLWQSKLQCQTEDQEVKSRFRWLWRSKLQCQTENQEVKSRFRWLSKLQYQTEDRKVNNAYTSFTHRSVMDLKAKGIKIRANYSPSLTDIRFTSNSFSGELELPGHPISDLSPVVFSNLIGYEASPNWKIDLVILSYVIFMKSLIQRPEDARELQQRGVFVNRFANLEKVVRLFKEIDTLGFQGEDIFVDVKKKIEEHCNNKAKTWMADLIHTRFQTPWTAIALFAAGFLICLTFLQTLFTIHPPK